jgi:hypothetical protein
VIALNQIEPKKILLKEILVRYTGQLKKL